MDISFRFSGEIPFWLIFAIGGAIYFIVKRGRSDSTPTEAQSEPADPYVAAVDGIVERAVRTPLRLSAAAFAFIVVFTACFVPVMIAGSTSLLFVGPTFLIGLAAGSLAAYLVNQRVGIWLARAMRTVRRREP